MRLPNSYAVNVDGAIPSTAATSAIVIFLFFLKPLSRSPICLLLGIPFHLPSLFCHVL
nr:MAG TPA: hypothetical protein [Caudoviricetes sp.]